MSEASEVSEVDTMGQAGGEPGESGKVRGRLRGRTGGPDGVAREQESERRVRRALYDAADAIEPHAWSPREVLGRAERRRRNRRIAVGLPVLAAVAAVGVVTAGTALGPHASRPAEAHHATSAPVLPATAVPPLGLDWPAVRVIEPGRVLDLGGGGRLRITSAERCVDWHDGVGWECRDESDKDGNQPPDSMNVQSYGYGTGVRYLLTYRGAGTPARMAVTVEGRTWPAQVLVPAGRPGWAAGYVDVPTSSARHDTFPPLALTTWDAQGRVLATDD